MSWLAVGGYFMFSGYHIKLGVHVSLFDFGFVCRIVQDVQFPDDPVWGCDLASLLIALE